MFEPGLEPAIIFVFLNRAESKQYGSNEGWVLSVSHCSPINYSLGEVWQQNLLAG